MTLTALRRPTRDLSDEELATAAELLLEEVKAQREAGNTHIVTVLNGRMLRIGAEMKTRLAIAYARKRAP